MSRAKRIACLTFPSVESDDFVEGPDRRLIRHKGVSECVSVPVDGDLVVWVTGTATPEELVDVIEFQRDNNGYRAVKRTMEARVVSGTDAVERLDDIALRNPTGLSSSVRRARREGHLDGPLDEATCRALGQSTDVENEGETLGNMCERIRHQCERIRRQEYETAIRKLSATEELTDAQRRVVRGLSAAIVDDVVRSAAGSIVANDTETASRIIDILDVDRAVQSTEKDTESGKHSGESTISDAESTGNDTESRTKRSRIVRSES